MLKITIELQSAVTLKTTKLGELRIWNEGHASAHESGNRKGNYNYGVALMRKGAPEPGFACVPRNPLRTGRVLNYASDAYSVWRLVLRALKECFPEERNAK